MYILHFLSYLNIQGNNINFTTQDFAKVWDSAAKITMHKFLDVCSSLGGEMKLQRTCDN